MRKTVKKPVKKSIKKAQIGYQLNAPLQKGTNRDRNLTGTTKALMERARYANKEKNSFIGPLTRFGNERSEHDQFVNERSDYDIRNLVNRQQKTGGKVKRAKTGTLVPKKSSVSKRVGSAKKSIGNRSMKRK